MSNGDVIREQDKFYGMYRGVVEDNVDPKQAGRVRVRVFPMFSGADKEALPWAHMADPSMGGFANVGGSAIPVINAHVFVFFENGDHRFPVYFAGAPAIENDSPDLPEISRQSEGTVSDINGNRQQGVPVAGGGTWNEPSAAHETEYPNNRVVRTKSGILVELDDTDGNIRFHVYHPSGSREEIDNDGNRVEHTEGAKYEVILDENGIYVNGDRNVTVTGNATVYAQGDMTVQVDQMLTLTIGSVSGTIDGQTGNVDLTTSGVVTMMGSAISLN